MLAMEDFVMNRLREKKFKMRKVAIGTAILITMVMMGTFPALAMLTSEVLKTVLPSGYTNIVS